MHFSLYLSLQGVFAIQISLAFRQKRFSKVIFGHPENLNLLNKCTLMEIMIITI